MNWRRHLRSIIQTIPVVFVVWRLDRQIEDVGGASLWLPESRRSITLFLVLTLCLGINKAVLLWKETEKARWKATSNVGLNEGPNSKVPHRKRLFKGPLWAGVLFSTIGLLALWHQSAVSSSSVVSWQPSHEDLAGMVGVPAKNSEEFAKAVELLDTHSIVDFRRIEPTALAHVVFPPGFPVSPKASKFCESMRLDPQFSTGDSLPSFLLRVHPQATLDVLTGPEEYPAILALKRRQFIWYLLAMLCITIASALLTNTAVDVLLLSP